MAADWFYQHENSVVGPLSAKELKWLATQGSLRVGTLIRRGASGDWFAAERLAAVLEVNPVYEVVEPEPTHANEWHFTRDGRKLGPVSFLVLAGLSKTGRLKVTDPVWTAELAEWTPAGCVKGLFETPTPASDPPVAVGDAPIPEDLPASRVPSRLLLLTGVAAIVLVAVTAELALRGRSTQRETKLRKRPVVEHRIVTKADVRVDPPPILAIKEAPSIAARIVGPAAPMRVPAIRDAPGRIAQPAPATARRAAVAVLHDPNVTAKPLPLGDRPRIDLAERAHRQADASQHATAASIDAVLDRPEEFLGSRFILEGVFKVGTRILNPKDKNGFKLGSTITIARDDDRTISTLEGKVFGHDLHIILEEQVARNLQQLFGRLKMAATTKPTYKTILGVRIENSPKEVDGEPALIVIESLEILGSCDYYLVASRSYANAFKVALVDVTGGRIDHGDGEKWVSRLGGEEKFVGPLRRKLRDLRRRAINDAHGAVVDAVLRSELDRWSRISAAINTINTIQARRLTENH